MAYIVLVIGAVMALLGATAVATGYPIIQVERGWATVIAGTTLLAGGLVTMALGVLVHILMEVKLAFKGASQAAMGLGEPMRATAHDEPVFDREPHHTPILATAGVATAAVATAEIASHHETSPEHHHFADAVANQPPADPHSDEDHTHDPLKDEVLTPQAHDQSTTPPMDDWLDKAFADLALDTSPPRLAAEPVPSTQAEPEPLLPEHVHTDHEAPIADHDPAPVPQHAFASEETIPHAPVDLDFPHHEESQPVDPLPATEHRAEADHELVHPAHDHHADHPSEPAQLSHNEPAVIGRYDADGTSYTMFADGSIEAQSEAGIYRFASMADLKAFIES